MKQNLINIRAERFKKEKTYNSRILIGLLICILIVLVFLSALNARAKTVDRFRKIVLENVEYTRQIKNLLIEKEKLMKQLVKAKEIELESLLEKTIYFEAVKLKNRSGNGIMKPAYLKLLRKK